MWNELRAYAARLWWWCTRRSPTQGSIECLMYLIRTYPEMRGYTLGVTPWRRVRIAWWVPYKGWVLDVECLSNNSLRVFADFSGVMYDTYTTVDSFVIGVRRWGLTDVVFGENNVEED